MSADAKAPSPHGCRHFTGIQHETCKLGIRYDSVRAAGQMLPCMSARMAATSRRELGHCDQRREPTAGELEEIERKFQERMARTGLALDAVEKATAGLTRASGEVPCPVCAGVLRYSLARGGRGRAANFFNVKCDTPGCVEVRGH